MSDGAESKSTDSRAQLSGNDLAALATLMAEFTRLRELHLTRTAAAVEGGVQVNERAASFYEKFIILNGSTIALTVAFLGRIPAGHLPRHAFLWLVCPAWLLLLISIYCCSVASELS